MNRRKTAMGRRAACLGDLLRRRAGIERYAIAIRSSAAKPTQGKRFLTEAGMPARRFGCVMPIERPIVLEQSSCFFSPLGGL